MQIQHKLSQRVHTDLHRYRKIGSWKKNVLHIFRSTNSIYFNRVLLFCITVRLVTSSADMTHISVFLFNLYIKYKSMSDENDTHGSFYFRQNFNIRLRKSSSNAVSGGNRQVMEWLLIAALTQVGTGTTFFHSRLTDCEGKSRINRAVIGKSCPLVHLRQLCRRRIDYFPHNNMTLGVLFHSVYSFYSGLS